MAGTLELKLKHWIIYLCVSESFCSELQMLVYDSEKLMFLIKDQVSINNNDY